MIKKNSIYHDNTIYIWITSNQRDKMFNYNKKQASKFACYDADCDDDEHVKLVSLDFIVDQLLEHNVDMISCLDDTWISKKTN
jgi:hypothetical protein